MNLDIYINSFRLALIIGRGGHVFIETRKHDLYWAFGGRPMISAKA